MELLSKIEDLISDLDLFGYRPEWWIGFNKNKTFDTVPGGISSICLGLRFFFIWSQNLY